MVALGNFFFHHRNRIFPVFYLLLVVPSPSITDHLGLIWTLGLGVALAGQVLRVATIGLQYIVRGGRNRRVYADDLVTGGIFGHCRNPLYLGNILILAGLGLMSDSWAFNLAAIPLFIFMYIAIVRAEEDFLGKKFGDAYSDYRRDVNRWMPRVRGLGETFGEMEFNWSRVLIREYTTAYIWLSGALVLAMKDLSAADSTLYREHWSVGVYALAGLFVTYLVIRTLKIRKVIRA